MAGGAAEFCRDRGGVAGAPRPLLEGGHLARSRPESARLARRPAAPPEIPLCGRLGRLSRLSPAHLRPTGRLGAFGPLSAVYGSKRSRAGGAAESGRQNGPPPAGLAPALDAHQPIGVYVVTADPVGVARADQGTPGGRAGPGRPGRARPPPRPRPWPKVDTLRVISLSLRLKVTERAFSDAMKRV